MGARHFILFIVLLLLGIGRLVQAEHELAFEVNEEEDTARQGRLPAAPSSQTLRTIQETLARTDFRNLETLKQALTEIAQGRVVAGPIGQEALNLLDQIPDEEVRTATSEEEAPTTSPTADRQPAAYVPAATVRVQAPVAQSSGASPRSVPTVANVPQSASLSAARFNSFGYGASVEKTDALVAESDSDTASGKTKRKLRPLLESGASGSELPSGQGAYASGSPVSKSRAAAVVSPNRQQLAAAVSSLLGRFQGRAVASRAVSKPGLFERFAIASGLSGERALATAASSSTFRKFQMATSQVGLSPSESLGAYYSVLVLAWLGTFAFLGYCLRQTPLFINVVAWWRRARR